MNIDQIVDHVVSLGGVLTLRPRPGDGSPEVSWGDVFFYYEPDGRPPHGQPFATVVTKCYPDEPPSTLLDEPEAFRLNIAVGTAEAAALTEGAGTGDRDTWVPHPVYGRLGWVAVVDPGERTARRALELLTSAHSAARARHDRRGDERT